jgi:lipoprotein-anchoring transpeptidase ErfK/SrfK
VDADSAHTRATIPAGPNGPVGVVWILATGDAMTLAALVREGTTVRFVE